MSVNVPRTVREAGLENVDQIVDCSPRPTQALPSPDSATHHGRKSAARPAIETGNAPDHPLRRTAPKRSKIK